MVLSVSPKEPDSSFGFTRPKEDSGRRMFPHLILSLWYVKQIMDAAISLLVEEVTQICFDLLLVFGL